MRIRLITFSVAVLATSAFTASAFGDAAGPTATCSSGIGTTNTASYRMALDIGPQENMYLPSEVKARHLKTGEIMLGGEMAMVSPTAGTRVYHLEVHICNKAGVVVTNLKPAIVVGTAVVPAAIMVGIGAPHSDYHYGNDIALKPGARVTVKVTVRGQLAVFHATVPKM
jgi:hypothetical protein